MIRIICVGKIKESFYRDAVYEYLKRMQKYHKVVIDEVMDSEKRKEGELILGKIHSKDYVVTLEIDGKEMDSLAFATFIDSSFLKHGSIVFVIGGSDGLDDSVKLRSNYQISFSKMTFPHQLFRVILLEQIYRAFKILHHESYHK